MENLFMKTWLEVEHHQEMASKILTNSIRKGRISHAYLIQGARNTGKQAIAELFAKTMLCLNRVNLDPCHTCKNCKRIDSRNHPDILWVEPEGQSIKNEQINRLKYEVNYSGLESSQKIYIIKDADTLTLQAANRILKFLEEPTTKTIAILLTENSQSVMPTIHSRCQIIDLKPLNPTKFYEQLIETGLTKERAQLLSALTNNLDEAIQWNEDDWFAQARKLMIQWMEIFCNNHADAYLFLHTHFLSHFKETEQLQFGLDLLMIVFKDLLYYRFNMLQSIKFFTPEDKLLQRCVYTFSEKRILEALKAILQAKQRLKQRVNSTLVMEQLTLHI